MGARTARRQAFAGPLAVGGAAAAGALALRLRDPHASGSWGVCPLQRLTGIYCPGCGGLRAVNDLTHLDIAAALSSNVLVVALLPVALLLWTRWLARLWRGGSTANGSAVDGRLLLGALAGVTLVFTVVRNLPAGAWMAP